MLSTLFQVTQMTYSQQAIQSIPDTGDKVAVIKEMLL